MARGRNPEETRRKILEVSRKLFLEKGFDNTSVQDIIDQLGGMTKGVIYYHFKSKFDILQAIVNVTEQDVGEFKWHGNNGLEKLQNSLKEAFSNLEQQKLAYSAAITLRSPRLLGEQYLDMFKYAVPEIQALIQEGRADGSIKTNYPEELADLIVLTLNIWIGFQSSVLTEDELRRKISFIKLTFDGLGVPVINDELLDLIYKLFNHLKKE
ncbi:TetR family transcriptional regulator [Loigolactobacillus backii]|uniref:TetR family transcriptional regulator n=1 Tax=Loigolactobacillus backii TaxID=375175 RepID=A0A192H327_9LACO|nr:TetR/AcrR family transcriptional regulator [Loigolactobacillus backii]ANK60201.1 TetR family transcriptional regulator [Loigolactobacillus backii]ANK62356.1 TetR family transcriptional regulator [Loigolactobacillus backii]ANK65083.1 TetR family transcriptional regulator [Loigolactobacillus backii]ANK67642.1 TetR family transcriptional regulator [Loigolactobacillus backii]ANK70632.1 TetR family transcriptional regulator [Loigolactobacillus backii]